ncbi:hypothetical protein IV203_035306 [Nitzschia inconspicua]|uniref:Uncharacterized protein n=1 Tax=Nitzschia inconspicua TaxID=303405 RepID=A0A9K3PUI3_9STRA|nr:hypothetical protein IV203_035306 [Nitzschia inconspicua]
MWSFGRVTGRVEDTNPPELQQKNTPHSSSNHHPQRQYYERPMSPQQQQHKEPNIGRGRHHFNSTARTANGKHGSDSNPSSSNANSKNSALSPRNHHPISPRQPGSPREYQRNNNKNFKAKKRFVGAKFLGSNKNKKNTADLNGVNLNETTLGIEISFEPPTSPAASLASPTGGYTNSENNRSITTKNTSSPIKHIQNRNKFKITPRNNRNQNRQRRKEDDRDPSVAEEDSLPRFPLPAISFQEYFRERQRIYKSQFMTTLLPTSTTTIVPATSQHITVTAANTWRPQGHRIPLCSVNPPATNISDALQLLHTLTVVDEESAVRLELSHLNAEITALERDRAQLEKFKISVAASKNQKLQKIGSDSPSLPQGGSSFPPNAVDWDVNVALKNDSIAKEPLPAARRMALQQQRGNCLSIHIYDARVQEMLVNKCGGKLANIQRSRLFKNDDTILTLSPDSCHPQGAATTLQQVAMVSSSVDRSTGFFLSKDSGPSLSGGYLPNRLFRRMKRCSAEEKQPPKIGDIKYLSTGPGDSYYAEFHSGECLWGLPVEDPELQYVFQTWDVYRVALGPLEFVEEEEGSQVDRDTKKTVVGICSWIVLGQDGRAVWKNLPTSLNQKLECRLGTRCAPVEVSLGSGGSYFVRFVDGSVDYCLPAKVARVCDRIEKRGGSITSVCLHADISHDFIIRHTELTLPR